MAFGFFKKQTVADTIFINGRIYTLNPDQPWAEAVAVADGEIIAVGDTEEIREDFENDDTEIVDLEGKVLTPGLIDPAGHPVMKSFEALCFRMEPHWDLQRCMDKYSNYLEMDPDREMAFAFGYNENMLAGIDPRGGMELLDQVAADIPVAALSGGGRHLWMNSRAAQLIRETAEAEEVEQINLSYALGILAPIDPDELLEQVLNRTGEYCHAGFTTIFDSGAPDYFLTLYQGELVNMYQEELFKQRFFGSLLLNRNVDRNSLIAKLMQNRTNCAELNNIINFNALKLVVDRTNADQPGIPAESLQELVLAAAERNFDIHADAVGEGAAADVLNAYDFVRSAGYKRNVLVLATDQELSDEEKENYLAIGDVITVPPTWINESGYPALAGAETMEEVLRRLTQQAAEQLGMEEKLGSIEEGKYADLTIFEDDPFDRPASEFENLEVAMTMVSGIIVYDAEEDDMSSWYELLSQQQY